MLEHGHDDEGLKWTREILRADPNHVPTHRVLAEYYQKHGDLGWRTIIASGRHRARRFVLQMTYEPCEHHPG